MNLVGSSSGVDSSRFFQGLDPATKTLVTLAFDQFSRNIASNPIHTVSIIGRAKLIADYSQDPAAYELALNDLMTVLTTTYDKAAFLLRCKIHEKRQNYPHMLIDSSAGLGMNIYRNDPELLLFHARGYMNCQSVELRGKTYTDRAIEDLTTALQQNPSNPHEYYLLRAQAYFKKNQFDKACVDVTKVLIKFPQHPEALALFQSIDQKITEDSKSSS